MSDETWTPCRAGCGRMMEIDGVCAPCAEELASRGITHDGAGVAWRCHRCKLQWGWQQPVPLDHRCSAARLEGSDDAVDHPAHYGGADNPYEAIKVIDAWQLGFSVGNCVKYIARAGRKPGSDMLTDLRKAAWYLQHEIERLEKK